MKEMNSKELFEFIRSADTKIVPELKSILSSYEINKLSIVQLLDSLKGDKNILLIDARSEKEFEESSIPFSKNFPVLTNSERHNVGLIYKNYSQSAALWLAMEYANPKSESLKNFLDENNAAQKIIFVYCWRGGGRSGYLSKMIFDLGFKASALTGGQRSYRKLVNEYFSQKLFPYDLIELSGLTGTGKTELLKSLLNQLPVINLEEAAGHHSSLLGRIPYEIRSFKPVENQSAFENNLFAQIYFNSFENKNPLTFLIESESKKVGNFEIPKILYGKMLTAPALKIVSSMENRIRRIVMDYFGNDLRGIEHVRNKLIEKQKFFRQQMSKMIFDELISLLDKGRVEEFTGIMLTEYYDKRYKVKGKIPEAEISSDDFEKAKTEIINFVKSI